MAKKQAEEALPEEEPTEEFPDGDGGRAIAQEAMDVVTDQGFVGVAVDPTPNENYTMSGVSAGAPTPETDVEAEKAAAAPGPLETEAILDEARAANSEDEG